MTFEMRITRNRKTLQSQMMTAKSQNQGTPGEDVKAIM